MSVDTMPALAAPLDLDLDALEQALAESLDEPEPAAEPAPAPTKHEPAAKPEPADAPKQGKPTFNIPQVEAHPTLSEAIRTAVEKVLTGNHRATVDKRKAIIAELEKALVNAPVYGIDVDNARVPIGDVIDLGNAVVELDGYGRASRITVDAGTPLWDVE